MDDGQGALRGSHVASADLVRTQPREPIHTAAAEPSKKKQGERTLAISYEGGSRILDTLNVDSSASGPSFRASRMASAQSPLHAHSLDRSKSGPLIGQGSLFAESSAIMVPYTSDVNPVPVKSDPQSGGVAVVKRVPARGGAKGFSEDSMEEVVLEMMRIDQESIARPRFASPAGAAKPQGLAGDQKVTETVTSLKGGPTLTSFENRPLTEPQQEAVNVITSQLRAGPTSRDVSPSLMRRGRVPTPARDPSPGKRNPGRPPRGLPVTGAKTPGLPRGTSPALPSRQSPVEGAGKVIHRNETPPYSATLKQDSVGLPRRAKVRVLKARFRVRLCFFDRRVLCRFV